MNLLRMVAQFWPQRSADSQPSPQISNPNEKTELRRRHEWLMRTLAVAETELETEQRQPRQRR